MAIKVTVTKQNIQKANRIRNAHRTGGVPDTGEVCPVAQALKSQGRQNPQVAHTDCTWDGAFYYALPQTARDFISRWDNEEKVEPISFYLRKR